MSVLDFMPPGIQADILSSLLTTLQADAEVSGVLVAGSFARGDAYPASDLDVYALLEDEYKRPFSAEMQNGILVEVSYADFTAAKAKIEKNVMGVYTYLDGRILYDRTGRLAALVQISKERFDNYQVSFQECTGIAHWLRSACVKVNAAQQAGDELKAAYIVATISFEVFAALWAINQRPLPASGGVLAHLPFLSQQPTHLPDRQRVLFCGSTEERIFMFLQVSAWAIALLEQTETTKE